MNNTNLDNTQIIADELAYLSGENVPANPVKRAVAFLMDMIVAYIPALAFLIFFASTPVTNAPAFYACPIIGSLSLFQIPGEVDTYMNNLVDASDSTTTAQLKEKQDSAVRNVSFLATSCRILSIFVILFYVGYGACCTYLFDGITVGKYFMHLKVVPEDENRKFGITILLREGLGKILLNSIPIIPIISVFTILFTPSHKAIHDYIGKTRVLEQ